MERNNSHDDQQDPQILVDHVNNRDNEEEDDHEDDDDHYDTSDGFLVDNDEEHEQSEDTNDEDDEDNLCLDEDDYSLVQENKTFKRLRKSSRVVKTLIYDEEDDLGDFIVDEDDEDHGVKSSSLKKRKCRQGIDSDALRFANELFGDPQEFLKLRREIVLNENVERKLEDKYKPEKDEEIRKLNTVDEVSFEEESDWIFAQLGHYPVEKVKAPRFKSRMIVHPRFMNISDEEAKVYLSDKDIGECIVRPSSRGLNHLTLMVKIFDNVYAHKEIIEGGKEKNDALSLQRIGKTLQMGNEIFEDLDVVMDRYVDPLVTHVKTMINYRKFKNGTKSEIDDLLQVEKAENPTMVAYGLGVSYEHPGSFILSYIRCANPHHEYIGLYPNEFKFRKIMFEDLDKLVSYFKKHINDDPMQFN